MTNIVPYRFDGLVNFQCTYYFTLTLSVHLVFLVCIMFFPSLRSSASNLCELRTIFFWLCKKAKNLNDIDYVMQRYERAPISFCSVFFFFSASLLPFFDISIEDKNFVEVIHIEHIDWPCKTHIHNHDNNNMKQVTWIDKKLQLAMLRFARPLCVWSVYILSKKTSIASKFKWKKKYTKSENIHFDGNDVNAMVTSKQQTYLIILFQRRADFVLNLFFFLLRCSFLWAQMECFAFLVSLSVHWLLFTPVSLFHSISHIL